MLRNARNTRLIATIAIASLWSFRPAFASGYAATGGIAVSAQVDNNIEANDEFTLHDQIFATLPLAWSKATIDSWFPYATFKATAMGAYATGTYHFTHASGYGAMDYVLELKAPTNHPVNVSFSDELSLFGLAAGPHSQLSLYGLAEIGHSVLQPDGEYEIVPIVYDEYTYSVVPTDNNPVQYQKTVHNSHSLQLQTNEVYFINLFGEVGVTGGLGPDTTSGFVGVDPMIFYSVADYPDVLFDLSPEVGNSTGKFLSGVPETSTWAMMIAGFGLIGATMRLGKGVRRDHNRRYRFAR